MTITIDIPLLGRAVKAAKGRLLTEALEEAGIPLNAYCQGRGVCGKCFVEILEGPLPFLTDQEKWILERRGLSPQHRLSCQYRLQDSLRINLPPGSRREVTVPGPPGLAVAVSVDPAVKKYCVPVVGPTLSSPWSGLDALREALLVKKLDVPIAQAREAAEVLGQAGTEVTAALHNDQELLGLEPGDTSSLCYGLAFDIGTTTIAAELVDLNSGRVLDQLTVLNSQAAYGADVVSRISQVFAEPDKAPRLRRAVVNDMSELCRALLKKGGVDSHHVYDVVVAANTAMNHLLLGMPVKSLAVAPFHAAFSSLPPLWAQDMGLHLGPQAKAYIAPNIQSFVGGDIAAGLLASGFAQQPGTCLYIDLGTNGEIVLKKGKTLVATSTAAGPAFEGMNISCGMLAQPGAVYRAENDNGLKAFTIDGEEPRGLCGTGLIDVVAVSVAAGAITPQGAIRTQDKKVRIAQGLSIDQKDVRELQLAVGAIRSGWRMMLAEHHLSNKDIGSLYIAGAFGSYLNIGRSMDLGLLPSLDPAKVRLLGNASLAGARALLLSRSAREDCESLSRSIRHYSLAAEPSFQEVFLQSLEFKRWP